MRLGKLQKVSVNDLAIGMFVAELDRPWLESPFSFQGFLIEKSDEIALLQKHCQYVFIDEYQGISPVFTAKESLPPLTADAALQFKFDEQGNGKQMQQPTFEQQKRAMVAYRNLQHLFDDMCQQVENDKPIIIAHINKHMYPLIESCIDNLAALLQLIMLTPRELSMANDAIITSIMAIAIGHRLEMHKLDLVPLATGALLLDIGKLKLPQELLDEPRAFTPTEFELVKSHVKHSFDIVRNAVGADKELLDMVHYHHERYNGSGYPAGLRQDKIPLSARIAGVADCFAAIVCDRPYSPAMSPYFAAQKLVEWRNEDFDGDIIDALVQEIGIYPIGTIVELNNGEVAVVIAQAQRLRPLVAVVLGSDKTPLSRKHILDLQLVGQQDATDAIKIQNAVENGVYKIDLNNLPL